MISYKLNRKIGSLIICLTTKHDWILVAPETIGIDQKLCARCQTLKTRTHKKPR